MKKLLVAVSFVALTAAAVHADPIEDREALMKSFGQAMAQLAPVAKGEKPFDAPTVQAALATLNDRAQKLDVAALFPAGSTSDKSEASPKIWEDWAGFEAGAEKFKTSVAAAAAAAPADVAALQTHVGAIGSSCGTCHQSFRLKKD